MANRDKKGRRLLALSNRKQEFISTETVVYEAAVLSEFRVVDVEKVVRAYLKVLNKYASQGYSLRMQGVGTIFSYVKPPTTAQRMIPGVKGSQTMEIPATYKVKFSPYKGIKKSVEALEVTKEALEAVYVKE